MSSVNKISFLQGLTGARYTAPARTVAAQYEIKNQFVGKTNLNAPEHRDMCNVELLGDNVDGKALYLLA